MCSHARPLARATLYGGTVHSSSKASNPACRRPRHPRAREHNLKDVTVRLPRNALICITGLSGSREVVALAFDTLYAEGQRR
jgi:hypothetical protein